MITLDMGIELLDGTLFSYEDPDVSGVDIEMLADVLSRICRFAGHVRWFYSVAQHSVNTSFIVPAGQEKAALLHDTAEAFTNDMVTPLKHRMPDFKVIEQRIESRINAKFGVPFPLTAEVKLADTQMLGIEKSVLKPSAGEWEVLEGVEYDHLRDRVIMDEMSPREAKNLFLARWEMVK